jgi:hypothetical protein
MEVERAMTKVSEEAAVRVPLSRGLSTKLLLLTILFVMIAEVLIFLPSMANFRLGWLEERLSNAATVGLVLMETEPDSLSREVQDDVLRALGAIAVAVRDEGASQILVVSASARSGPCVMRSTPPSSAASACCGCSGRSDRATRNSSCSSGRPSCAAPCSSMRATLRSCLSSSR